MSEQLHRQIRNPEPRLERGVRGQRRLDHDVVEDAPVLDPEFESARQAASRIPEHWSKRAFDVVASSALLLVGGVFLALIWLAHIGMDRTAGYGLKYPTEFKDTHMQHV